MALVRISDKVWVAPDQVVRITEGQDGMVYVDCCGMDQSDRAGLFEGDGQRLVERIDEQVSFHRDQLRRCVYELGEAVLERGV